MLARWTNTQHAAEHAISVFQHSAEKSQAERSNKDFLERLKGAERRDEERSATPALSAATSPLPQRSVLAMSGFDKAIVPLVRARPGEDTHRENEAAQKDAKLKERETAAHARKLQGPARKLSSEELKVAADLFYEFDGDANASIDRQEWVGLMQELARRTGKPLPTTLEAQQAFDLADSDGNGELDLHEWLAAQREAIGDRVQVLTAAAPGARASSYGERGGTAGSSTADTGDDRRRRTSSEHRRHHEGHDDQRSHSGDLPQRHRSGSKGRDKSRRSSKHEGDRHHRRRANSVDLQAAAAKPRQSSVTALDDSVAEQLRRDWAAIDQELEGGPLPAHKTTQWRDESPSGDESDGEDAGRGGGERSSLPNSWVGSFKRLVGGSSSASFLKRATDAATHAAESFKQHAGRGRRHGDGRDGGRRRSRSGSKQSHQSSSGGGGGRRSSGGGGRRSNSGGAEYLIAVP